MTAGRAAAGLVPRHQVQHALLRATTAATDVVTDVVADLAAERVTGVDPRARPDSSRAVLLVHGAARRAVPLAASLSRRFMRADGAADRSVEGAWAQVQASTQGLRRVVPEGLAREVGPELARLSAEVTGKTATRVADDLIGQFLGNGRPASPSLPEVRPGRTLVARRKVSEALAALLRRVLRRRNPPIPPVGDPDRSRRWRWRRTWSWVTERIRFSGARRVDQGGTYTRISPSALKALQRLGWMLVAGPSPRWGAIGLWSSGAADLGVGIRRWLDLRTYRLGSEAQLPTPDTRWVVPVTVFCVTAVTALQWRVGGLAMALLAGSVTALLVTAAAIDLDVHRLPDALTGGAVVLTAAGLAAVALVDRSWGGAVRAMLSGGALATWYWAIRAVAGGNALGMGDVKLAPTIGMLLGYRSPTSVVDATALAFVSALLTLVWQRGARQTPGSRAALPFGPHLAVGAVAALIWAGRRPR